jgi:hypothetical protein
MMEKLDNVIKLQCLDCERITDIKHQLCFDCMAKRYIKYLEEIKDLKSKIKKKCI